MKTTIKLLAIIGMSLILQACGGISPETSCNFVQNSDKQRVSWANLPVKVFLHESIPSERIADIEAAVEHWNQVSQVPLIQIVSHKATGNLAPTRDGVSLVTWHENWGNDNHKEQARTTINWAKSKIYESDIKVNAQSFIYHDDGFGTPFVDLTSLMIHEFGHLLGLAHNEDVDSVMKSKLGFGVRRGYSLDLATNEVETDIREVDKNSMSCEYIIAE